MYNRPKYDKFDRSLIQQHSLSTRQSKVYLSSLIFPEEWRMQHRDIIIPDEVAGLAREIFLARQHKQPIVFFLSGHVVKHGLSYFVLNLLANGYITHLACNGSVLVHDFELAEYGHTSEDVGEHLKDGRFGNWAENKVFNSVVNCPRSQELGLGERLGLYLTDRPNKPYSLLQQAYKRGVPLTSHVLVGGDIVHQHPGCDGAMLGQATYNDFLIFTQSVHRLQHGGVYVNVGSQVTGVEIFLKSLSMAKNVWQQRGVVPGRLTTGLLDFVQLPANWRDGEASEGEAAYYYRPWKTLLLRAVADGGRSYYVGGPHAETLPILWEAIRRLEL